MSRIFLTPARRVGKSASPLRLWWLWIPSFLVINGLSHCEFAVMGNFLQMTYHSLQGTNRARGAVWVLILIPKQKTLLICAHSLPKDSLLSMSSINLARYKRIVQYFWDPEPLNYAGSSTPIWCLGSRYGCKAEEFSTKSDPLLVYPQGDVIGHDVEQEQHRSGTFGITARELIDLADVGTSGSMKTLTGPRSFWTILNRAFGLHIEVISLPSEGLLGQRTPEGALFPSNCVAIFSTAGVLPPTPDGVVWSDQVNVFLLTLSRCYIWEEARSRNRAVMVNDSNISLDWRRGTQPIEERRILALFADDIRAPFSIHRFVEHGASACGKYPGEWFGPSATARCIQWVKHPSWFYVHRCW